MNRLFVLSLVVLAGCGSKESSGSGGSASAKSSGAGAASSSAPASASAAPAASSAATAGACKLVGEFAGKTMPGPTPMNNKDITVTFGEDGKSEWVNPVAKNVGAFKLDDKGNFSISNTGESSGRFSCAKGQEGKYTATWGEGCGSITFKLVEDGCKGRSQAMNGIQLNRKKGA